MLNVPRWITLPLFSLICQGAPISVRAQDPGKIVIEGPHRAIQGFPLVLRIVARGPLQVPMTSLYDVNADIHVNLSQKKGDKTYKFYANASMGFDRSPEGGHIDRDGRELVNNRIGDKEEMAILVDVPSLNYGRANFLSVPPGEYLLSVTFPHAKKTSEALALELIAPSPADRAFLDEVVEPAILPRRREVILWTWVLGGPKSWRLPVSKTKELLDPAKGQMQFHVLVYQIEKGEVRTRQQAAAYPVPKYLELEKQWVLLKLDRANKVAGAEQALQAFVETHPEFRWRLQPAFPGSNLFQNIAD